MKNLAHTNESQTTRPTRLLGSSLAVAAVVAAGLLAGPAGATPSGAQNAAHAHGKDRFKHPKLRHGVLTIEGTDAGETIALRLKSGDPDVLQVDVGNDGSADFRVKLKHVTRIVVDAESGDDHVLVDEINGAFTDRIPTTIDGDDGDDDLDGGSGAERFLGGNEKDSIDGNRGNDIALMGAGDDTFVWDPGDGSDVVEGEYGADTMLFNGANAAERFDMSANGNRLRFFRDLGNITMDTDDVETVDVEALGGADVVTVGDLTGTDVTSANVDLEGTPGGGAGDGQPDRVVVTGTNGNDTIAVAGNAAGVAVSGLPALVSVRNQEPTDELAVNGSGGNDGISATGLAAGTIVLSLDGGGGDDTLAGGPGIETLLGGDENDTLDGNGGNDVGLMGAGDDTFVWDPGDGSDVVEGQAGNDRMLFNGSNGAEQFDLSANGERLRFFRNLGNITMDTNDVETVDLRALGGADLVTVNDLSGTDVATFGSDLAGTPGGSAGDGQPDDVIVKGTNGDDVALVTGSNGAASVLGLAATVHVTNAEPANDSLALDLLAGDDVGEASGLGSTSVELTMDAGAGNDVLVGSAGADVMFGREGDDVLVGGPGLDILDGGEGDNVVIQD